MATLPPARILSLDRRLGGDCDLDGFVKALLSGGDSRIGLDPATDLNKYFCPPEPAGHLACVASCTASPISPLGWEESLVCYEDITSPTARAVAARGSHWQETVKSAIAAYFGLEGLADVQLTASGTDAVAWTAAAIAAEQLGRCTTAILPGASETGAGVGLAAACRAFDPGPSFGRAPAGMQIHTVEVRLRTAEGVPREDGDLVEAFARAASAARGRAVVYLTHGSKTGLVAPLEVPPGAEVIVDACQARIAPAAVRRYLRLGWPVIVTGSKFFGGPPFSGAVLVPTGRFGKAPRPPLAAVGPLLRWMAALSGIEAAWTCSVPDVLARYMREVEATLSGFPGVSIVDGPSPAMCEAGGWPPSIVTFEVAHPGSRIRMTAEELRPLYQDLARLGVLVGQPVSLGRSGGLRVAVGARDLSAAGVVQNVEKLGATLRMLLPGQIR